MKKQILLMLSIVVCSLSMVAVEARTAVTPEVNNAIRLYKASNYTQCYEVLQKTIIKDPSNALAYYYLAMSSAQIGKKDEAIQNYSRVLELTSGNTRLNQYAEKGKRCIETPDLCHGVETLSTQEDKFIKGKFGSGFSNQVRSEYEKQKIENLMREINRKDEVEMRKFNDYKDFSSSLPSNDEIVNAVRVLQQAGMTDVLGYNGVSDFSILNGTKSNEDALFNLLNGSSNASLNPQVIQTLLTNQMSLGF